MNIDSYMTLRDALAEKGDEETGRERIEIVFLPSDSLISCDTYFDEIDDNEDVETTPSSFAGVANSIENGVIGSGWQSKCTYFCMA